MKFDEEILIENFEVMKNEHDKKIGLFFCLASDWIIKNKSIVEVSEKNMCIYLYIEHDNIITRLSFKGFENKKVHHIAFENLHDLIKKNNLLFIAKDNDALTVIPTKE